jgi:hypothetical protein
MFRNKALDMARAVKWYSILFLRGKRSEWQKFRRIRDELESKRQELSRIKNELRRTTKDPAERNEYRRRINSIEQEKFRLKGALRALTKREWTAGEKPETGALPDFLIIGGKKCGTTSLYFLLAQHPLVDPAAKKELHFFNRHFDAGIEWYRRCFLTPRWKDGRRSITGEATPEYLTHPSAPKRAVEVIPQVRLIALLRNPVDRAYSDYQQAVRGGRESRTFEEAMEYANLADAPRNYLSKSIYVDQLKRWSTFFSEEQLLVLKSEDFFEHPQQTLKAVLDFLELPDWEPRAWEIRKKGRYEQGIDLSTRRTLEEYFEPHNRRLYDYLGVDFGW